MFTDDELYEIHKATLEVLEETGLMIFSDEAQEMFYSHGCKVDKKTKIVKIPPYLVEEAIRSAPSSVLLAGRNPKNDLVLGGNRVAFTNFNVAAQVLDFETGKVRESTKKDLTEAAILVDALEDVDYFTTAVTPRDAPNEVVDVSTGEISLNNTSKHVQHTQVLSAKEVRRFFEMGVAIVGSAEEMRRRPIGSIAMGTVSPLMLIRESSEPIQEAARLGIPCFIGTEPMAGGTSPVTLAGTAIVMNAEELGGIVLNQLTRKGSPVIYVTSSQMLDLLNINALVGNPETALLSVLCANLARYYNLPSFVAGG